MLERTGEPVGFLCRWCLLALAGAIVLLASAAMVMTAGYAVGDVCPSLAIGDIICVKSPSRNVVLVCTPLSELPDRPIALLLASTPQGPLTVSSDYHGMLILRLDRSETGRYPIRLIGAPYGAMAFYSNSILLQVVPLGEDVFLVDSHLASSVPDDELVSWRESLRIMRKRGKVGIFPRGEVSKLNDTRKAMAALYPGTAVLFSRADKKDLLWTVYWASWLLESPEKLGRIMPHVVTADPAIANRAASRRFPVYLISTNAPRRSNVTSFATLHEFRDYLVSKNGAGHEGNQ